MQPAVYLSNDPAHKLHLDCNWPVNGKRDSRRRSEHAQILSDQDIPRFAQLGVIASMQPTHCITDKRFCEKRIGFERSKGACAWRRLLSAGARIAFGTDYAVEPLDPLEGLYASVTRKDRAGEPGEGWFPDQRLTTEEAIGLYTLFLHCIEMSHARFRSVASFPKSDSKVCTTDPRPPPVPSRCLHCNAMSKK